MANVNISTLVPNIATSLRSCEEAMQLQALRRAGREFCLASEVWREDMNGVELDADDTTVTLTVPAAYVADILRVRTVKQRLATETDLTKAALLDERLWTLGVDNVLTLVIAPNADSLLDLNVVYLPRISCSLYPDWLLNRWSEGFCAGALGLLMEQPGKPWSDKPSAQYYQQQFRESVARAKREGWQGRKSGNQLFTTREFV